MAVASSSSQSTRATAAFHVPIDITIEILSRLPVTSLLRFRSVCKTWYALISSPSFISKHRINRSTLNPTSSFTHLLVTTKSRGSSRCIGMWLHYFNSYGFFDGSINLDFPFLNGSSSLSILGVCDGLVCLSVHKCCGDVFLILCNPATKQFREIPHCQLVEGSGLYIKWVRFGLGFDPAANGYKLIRIAYCKCPIEGWVFRAHLYAISTGTTWREIDASKLSSFGGGVGGDNDVLLYGGSLAPAVMNGVIYWQAMDFSSKERVVVSFDMGDEVFRKITTPRCLDDVWNKNNWRIMQMKGKLGLVTYSRYSRRFDEWVLNENEMSWTNQVKDGFFPIIANHVGCGENNGAEITVVGCGRNGGKITVVGCGRNDGELVVTDHEVSGEIKLFSYDPKSQEIRNLRFGRVPYPSSICLYAQTVLPVNERQ